MADLTFPVAGGATKKLKDMGDGTYAEVVTVAGLTVTADTVNLDTSDLETKLGAVTETAPASDIASSGLNGRLQRIAQRLTTMLTGISLAAGEAHLGQVGGTTPRISPADYVLAASASAYALGNILGNSATAASVVPITFANAARISGGSGRLTGMRCVASAASSNLVTTLFDFDLWVFRPGTNVPFAAGSYPADRAACVFTATALKDVVAVFSFTNGNWKSSGGVAAAAGYQSVAPNTTRPYAPFNLANLSATDLIGVAVAASAWSPGNIVQTLSFHPDIDQD